MPLRRPLLIVVTVALFGALAGCTAAPTSTAAQAAGSSATDYRFGASRTWQTKVPVVDQAEDGFASRLASVQSYPGLWLVAWPGDDSGQGRVVSETLVAMNPDTGAVKWSLTPGTFECAKSLTNGSLACVDIEKGALMVLDPATGKATSSALNGARANGVSTYKGDLVSGYEDPASGTDTIQRVKPDGTVVWKKTRSCTTQNEANPDGLTLQTVDQLGAGYVSMAKLKPNQAFLFGDCLNGEVDLESGTIDSNSSIGDDGCMQYSPFDDTVGLFAYGDGCAPSKHPILIPRGNSTLTAMTKEAYEKGSSNESDISTVWSANLTGADFSAQENQALAIAHLGSYALVASAGRLWGVDTQRGPSWEQSATLSGDPSVELLPIDATKPNTPVLVLEANHNTIERLDPGLGAARVSAEPKNLPSCPKGQTPVSFTTWDSGEGATLVCQGFARTVTVVLIVSGKTYTSGAGRLTPTGYFADFGGGVSVNIGLGGWVAWVGSGGKTILHAASKGWQLGGAAATAYPHLSAHIQSCPAGTYPLSLSTWNGGWLLTCGKTASTITKFLYVDGSTHGTGNAMTEQGGQSCGTSSTGNRVCVNASPAVVAFSSKGGSPTQHSVDANYVVHQGFSGAGKGTGAYGLPDPGANAASEVAYLNGILQQSQAARSSVKGVVRNILKCASVQADVGTAQAVVADRTTELRALNSAPVDAVPGGAALVAELQAVLNDSLTIDKAYVTAAGQVAAGNCSAGAAAYNAQKSLIAQVTNEKNTFVTDWNVQIAPKYGTPTYTQDNI